MKSFRHYLNSLDRLATCKLQSAARDRDFKSTRLLDRLKKISFQTMNVAIGCSAIGSSLGIWINPAQAVPYRKDWCGVIWSLEGNAPSPIASPFTLAWVNPTNGASSFAAPNANVTMPTNTPGDAAALGIHVQSGTLFAFDRTGTGQLYRYQFGVDTSWQPVATTGLKGSGSTPSTNLNKMTVDGNDLYLSDSSGSPLYSLKLDPVTGALTSPAATSTPYKYLGIPATTPLPNGGSIPTPTLGGGDITTDEYSDTYNVTYATVGGQTQLYFFKQDNTTSPQTWVYQGTAASGDAGQYGGAAFYKGDLYVKSSAGGLKIVDLTRSGSGYTGWGNLKAQGTGNGATDLAACGTPNLTLIKTQQIYTDAAATTLATNQIKVKTGQYLKYTITLQNTGDSWARSSKVADTLPAGATYVPNSATLNGTNLGFATYPATGFNVNTPGQIPGIIDFSASPNLAVLTFVVKVTAISGSIQNRATITYIDNTGLVSETPTCTTTGSLNNCGETPTLPIETISGTVFEDINYGGGGGRDLTASSGVPRPNATVELYDSAGNYKGSTTTGANGNYSFNDGNISGGIVAGDYQVRVVNSTVTSSRTGSVNTLMPVQTYRTDAGVTAGTVTPVTDRVGGEKPQAVDPPANTTSATLATLNSIVNREVQSIAAVKVTTSSRPVRNIICGQKRH